MNKQNPSSLAEVSKLKFDRSAVLYRQVCDAMREEIRSGRLPVGSKLPTTAELAKAWGLQVATVHQAMTILAREGLLVRRPKKGTLVAEKPTKIEKLGLLALPHADSERFKLSIMQWLQDLASARGISTVLVDRSDLVFSNENRQPNPHALGFDALIGVGYNKEAVKRLSRLPVPTAFLSSSRLPNTVEVDSDDFFTRAVHSLSIQGAKSVSLLTHMDLAGAAGSGILNDLIETLLPRLVAEAGMRLIPAPPLRFKPREEDFTPSEMEHVGFDLFEDLWQQPTRPEGLIVYPSTVSRGVVTSILSHQVNVPADLKVVLTRTKETPFLCPFPASIFETSTEVIAGALLDIVGSQFEGRTSDFKLLGMELLVSSSRE